MNARIYIESGAPLIRRVACTDSSTLVKYHQTRSALRTWSAFLRKASAGIVVTEVPGSNPTRSSVGLGVGRTVLGSILKVSSRGIFPHHFLPRVTATQRLSSDTYIHFAMAKCQQLANRNFLSISTKVIERQ